MKLTLKLNSPGLPHSGVHARLEVEGQGAVNVFANSPKDAVGEVFKCAYTLGWLQDEIEVDEKGLSLDYS